jgi:integrase
MTSSGSDGNSRTISGMCLISEYLGWLKLRRRRPKTISDRESILRRMDQELPYGLEMASADELKDWIFRDEWSDNTLATYFGAAKAFFVWATAPGSPKLDFNPMAELPPPSAPRGLPRPVTDGQLERILSKAEEPFRLWSLLAAYEGLRCMEIAGLHREHVTSETLQVVDGKGGKPGYVPTHPVVWEVVEPLPEGPLAWTLRGERATANYVSIRTACYFRRDLGMPGVGLHRLRHWFGTNLMRKTGNLRTVQEMLRHASSRTTEVYTLVASEERRAATLTLPTFTASSPAEN